MSGDASRQREKFVLIIGYHRWFISLSLSSVDMKTVWYMIITTVENIDHLAVVSPWLAAADGLSSRRASTLVYLICHVLCREHIDEHMCETIFSSIRFARCRYLQEINARTTEEKTTKEPHGLQCSTNLCTGETLHSSEIFNAERSRSNRQRIAIVTCSSDHGTKTWERERLQTPLDYFLVVSKPSCQTQTRLRRIEERRQRGKETASPGRTCWF